MLFYAIYPGEDWELPEIEQRMPIVDRPDLGRVLRKQPVDTHRLFKSHEPYFKYFLEGKVTYIVRDGRDSMASYYHYRQNMNRMKMSFSDYLERSLNNEFRYGSWPAHVSGWLAVADVPAMQVIKYEDMVEDPGRELRKVIEHFGLFIPDEQIARAVEKASVDRVSKGFAKVAEQSNRQFTGGTGGGSGKWRRTFSDQDLSLFMDKAGHVLKELGYEE